MTAAEVFASCIVPTTKSVFFLGCFDSRVTLYAQQVRALNLADALIQAGLARNNGRIAIVGGGAAGMTVAAALAVAVPKLEAIDLYERKSELLHLQLGGRDRYLHPHIYDWPREGSLRVDAALPILNWQAATANEVADIIEEQFHRIRKIDHIINLKTNCEVERLEPAPLSPGCRVFVKGQPMDRTAFYDAVILAIGYGYEACLSEPNLSYWAVSVLSGPILAAEDDPTILVSGNGDGGLVDFMMAAYNHLTHRGLLETITGYGGLGNVEGLLLEIDERAWTDGANVDIYEEYRRLVIDALPPHMLNDISKELRPDAHVWFHTREPALFKRETAILNRFGAFLAITADENAGFHRIHTSFGKHFTNDPPLTGEVQIAAGPSFTPRIRILRFGAEGQKNLEPFLDLSEAFRAGMAAAPAGFRPATPSLTDDAARRFPAPPAPIPGPEAVLAPGPAINLRQVQLRVSRHAEQFTWSGDLLPHAVGHAWDEDVAMLDVSCDIPAAEAGPVLAALTRLCGHAKHSELHCRDRIRWEDATRGYGGRSLPGPDIPWGFKIVGDLAPPNDGAAECAFDSAALAEEIHLALDSHLLAELHSNLFACLCQHPAAEIGWVLDPTLRQLMWDKWEAWHAELRADQTKRRRFLLLLATERDEVRPSADTLVRLGPKIMRPHLVRAAAFALAFTSCSSEAFGPADAYPGNIVAARTTGHASGISWIAGRVIGPSVSTQRWASRIVLLSELRTPFEVLRVADVRLDRLPGDPPRVLDATESDQSLIFGCDPEFQEAMEAGSASVSTYIAAAFRITVAAEVNDLES